MDNCKKIAATRARVTDELRKMGFEVLDSCANFIFAKSGKIGGEELYLKLKSRGILVRHFKDEKIKEYNRITIGTDAEMDAFLSAVDLILGE
jgi:histidinol-phosphate aminotransferase